MNSFIDNQGVSWSLKVTLGTLQDIREKYDLDLLGDPQESIKKLIEDETILLELAIDLTEETRRKQELSDRDFLDRLTGDILDEFTREFLESWADCLPKLKRRSFQALIKRYQEELDPMAEKLEKMIQEIPIEIPDLNQL